MARGASRNHSSESGFCASLPGRLLKLTARPFAIATFAAIVTLVITWSVLHAYVGDESFHLLAAKLIAAGKKPYTDFFYQHPPVFAYIMAMILRISGGSWRAVHIFSALCIIGCIVFAGALGRRIYSERNQRWWNLTFVTILIGANAYVLLFATTALPFAFSVLCATAALYYSNNETSVGFFLSGFLAAIATSASLLVSPILPVFFIWIFLRYRTQVVWMIAGLFVGFLPLLALLLIAPHQTIRDVIGFHFFDRPGFGLTSNIREVGRWLLPTQGLILTILAITSVRARNQPLVRLCALLAFVQGVVLLVIKANASFYFVVLTPFLSIAAASWLTDAITGNRRMYPAAIIVLYLVGLVTIRRFEGIEAPHAEVQQLAKAVEACAPSGNFYANEAVYFEASTLPPAYMENRYVPSSVPDAKLESGAFDAVLIAASNPKVNRYRVSEKYARKTVINYSPYDLLLFCDARR